jgi:hypothetical protein
LEFRLLLFEGKSLGVKFASGGRHVDFRYCLHKIIFGSSR